MSTQPDTESLGLELRRVGHALDAPTRCPNRHARSRGVIAALYVETAGAYFGMPGVNPWGRLKVGNRYVWVDFHAYCGPSFYTDSAMNKLYDPVDENDPVWEPFGKWLDKYNAAKAKELVTKKRRSSNPRPAVGGKAP